MGTAIKHPVPDWLSHMSFVTFDIWALWHSALSIRVPGCQNLQIVWHRMILNDAHFLTRCLLEYSGGAKGMPDGPCAPAVNPCAPTGKPTLFHSVMQHQFSEFCSTIFHSNRGQCFGTRRQGFESKFSTKKFPGDNTPVAFCGRRVYHTHTHPQHSLQPCARPKITSAGTQTIVPPSKLWCPTCAPARTNSWCRHCWKGTS